MLSDAKETQKQQVEPRKGRAWLLIAIVGAALAVRVALLAADVVPFDGDEAVVALMARHILRGARPLFFYGQSYMGSLDAYLIAAAFALFGESVMVVRLVQLGLFAAFLATGYGVALRFRRDRDVALLSVLLLALAPVTLTLYTTVSLGGYGESLLIGNLLLWLGHRLGDEDERRYGRWLAWGLLAGSGFWILGLTVVYVIPVAVWWGWQNRLRSWRGYGLAGVGFILGSIPWWWGRLDSATGSLVAQLIHGTTATRTAFSNAGTRLFTFVALGLPAVFGMRYPWSLDGPSPWLAFPALILYLGALGYALRRADSPPWREGRWILWGIWLTLLLGFVLTPFGDDPTGRYFLPLYLPLAIFVADALRALSRHIGRWMWAVMGALLCFNLIGVAQAATTYPPGLTANLFPAAQPDHRYDAALIDFLKTHNGTRGYSHYWVTYPIAFLSEETVILAPQLPYKTDLSYNVKDDRYPPYSALVEDSPSVVYVNTENPALTTALREQFTALGVTFQETKIGGYHVFYDLSRKVTPRELHFAGEAHPPF